jgi:V-type H+-transporting ATPase subunit a
VPDFHPPDHGTPPPQRGYASELQYASVGLDELPELLGRITENIEYLDSNYQNLARQKRQLVEYRTVVDVSSRYLAQSEVKAVGDEKDYPAEDKETEMPASFARSSLLEDTPFERRISNPNFGDDQSKLIRRITGTISEAKRVIMERMLFRASRGNVISRFIQLSEPVEDVVSGEKLTKLVFILFYSGQRVREKINKILQTLNANVYAVPDTQSEQLQLLADITKNIEQQADVLDKTRMLRDKSLQEIVGDLSAWKYKVAKERAIYFEMNKFNPDMSKASLVAEGWVCDYRVGEVRDALQRISNYGNDSPAPVLAIIHPPPKHAGMVPTHIETNQFTDTFQGIVDAYGKPNYREFNPGIFTIITFPFLFAVMFGDVGHGFLMVLAATYLIVNAERFQKDKNTPEMITMVLGGRWVILLMGMFSIYVGFIYNEIFSIPLPFWSQSKWTDITTDAATARQDGVYPFGIDPSWAATSVALSYTNSLKMKMAIVFGVVQMIAGIFCSLLNHVYFRRKIDIYFTFIPQIIFMTSIFGYLVLMMFIKWATDWQSTSRIQSDSPSLLQMMILMFLSSNGPDKVQLYSGQDGVEGFLKVVAFIMIPLLLIPKPALLYWKHKQRTQQGDHHIPLHDEHESPVQPHEEDHFNMGEMITMQLIHTLEFVLGCISNTASYLRLWALSLAHSQLSIVFWNYFIYKCMTGSGFMLFVGFSIWFGCTMGVLMCMESLSAFLHALRLHWVEFQNKFYNGSGKGFLPFNLKELKF